MRSNISAFILTIDLEEGFHGRFPDPECWSGFERRIHIGMDIILEMLDKYGYKATFFVLGDIAEKSPETVSKIASLGHEIGSHGMRHLFLESMTRKKFRQDIRQSLDILESITGTPVRSYRAPFFSITGKTLWALEIIREEGIMYDSSIFPIINPRYGIPKARRTPHEILPGLWECPVSTVPSPLGNIPFAGGFYFRFLPWSLIRRAIKILEKRNEPVLIYLHPWEIDQGQPFYKSSSWFDDFRHYYGLRKTATKIKLLLNMGKFNSLSSALDNLIKNVN